MIAVLWVIGQTAYWVPRGPFRTGVWSVHVVLGFITGLVLLTRVTWRAYFGRDLPPVDTGALHAIAKATQHLLYGLLAAAVLLGLVDASYRGFDLFGMWSVLQFGTGDAATRRSINEWHELAANLTVLVARPRGGSPRTSIRVERPPA